MEKFRSFLSVEDSSETCLLCGDLLLTKGKFTIFMDEGWISLKQQAERWSKINLSSDNSWFHFTLVFSKVADTSKAFGKAHTSCRTIFRTRIVTQD